MAKAKKKGTKKKKTTSKKKKSTKAKTEKIITKIIHEPAKEIKIDRALTENFIGLQKVMVNLSSKFDNLTTQISKLLELFEISAKSLAQKEIESGQEGYDTKNVMQRLDSLDQRTGLIGKGLSLMHEVHNEPRKTRTHELGGESWQRSNIPQMAKHMPQMPPRKPMPKTIPQMNQMRPSIQQSPRPTMPRPQPQIRPQHQEMQGNQFGRSQMTRTTMEEDEEGQQGQMP